MRRILVENARRKRAQKRGGEAAVELDDAGSRRSARPVLASDEALKLAVEKTPWAELVKLGSLPA